RASPRARRRRGRAAPRLVPLPREPPAGAARRLRPRRARSDARHRRRQRRRQVDAGQAPAALLRPAAGAIALDGVDLRVRNLRANVALVLQETLVFDGTIRENILFGRPDASPGELGAAVRAADL